MFSSRTSAFDRLLEKATSQLLLEPDWDSILGLCDCIRQEDVQPKYAMQAVKKKISNENPHVSLFALQTVESMVKNCGSLVHQELATKENMEFFKDLANKKSDNVKAKILELVQVWSHAFRNEPSYKIVQDTYNIMKMEGYNFPTLKESDAMFSAERAPEWKDGEVCSRCRTQFGTFNRKHHCRNCGGVFCGKCSSKNSIIPKFGIEREVRVCDSCYDILNKAENKEEDLPAEYLASPLSKQSQGPPSKSEQELQEEEELQLALALSQSEAESQKKSGSANYNLYGSSNKSPEPAKAPDPVVAAPTFDTSEMDPELARYLNRNYWQQKSEKNTSSSGSQQEVSSTQPTAPAATTSDGGKAAMNNSTAAVIANQYPKSEEKYQGGGVEDANREQFLQALESSIQIFTNRMKSNYTRGRSIANDSSVQTLFMTINQMHPQLLQYIGEQEDVRARYENLQDKLAQLKDAREALDVLRQEHREKKRREQEEMERQRAIQMAHKLEILRQKKQEYLEYQRQLALQRMAEQQRDMEMRLAQQKQMQMQRAMQYGMPSLPTQMYPQSISPHGGSAEGSPLHHAHAQQMQTPYGAPAQPQQPMMGVPPGAPGGQMQMGGPPMSITMPPGGGMGGPPVSQPSMYGAPQQQPASMPNGGYQAPGGYTPAGYHPGQPQVSYPNTTEFNSFNMQGMSDTLPSSNQQLPGQQPPGQPPIQPGMGQQPPPPPTQSQTTIQQHPPGMPPGSQPIMSNPQMMGSHQAPGQPPMGQMAMMGQPPVSQPSGGHQPPISQQHPGMPQNLPSMNQPPASMPPYQQPYMHPQQPAPGGQPVMHNQPQPGGMMGQPPPNMQQNYMGGPAPPPQMQQPPQQQPGQFQAAPPPGGAMPPQGQDQPSQGQQDVGQLISFD